MNSRFLIISYVSRFRGSITSQYKSPQKFFKSVEEGVFPTFPTDKCFSSIRKMCGQLNKKMTIQETVQDLTQECVELRRSLLTLEDHKEKEKIILKHIKQRAHADIRVNDFQKGLEWFNVSEGLSLSESLAGKIVILDFFTYCCINCMHILPDLDALEKKFSPQDGLVVVGVHSAKFSNERDSAKILSAVQRYNIRHPVVNDAKLSMWRDIGIVCWPSLVILGPKGQPLFVLVGEGHREEMFTYVKVALAYFHSLKQISNHGLPLKSANHLLPISKDIVLFPGKVQTMESESVEKLVVSDTGNNRILIMRIDGTVEDVIGGYAPGFTDGNYTDSRFNAPQGVCIFEKTIFVADNENHAIRKIDLEKKTVNTVAGTGSQGHDYTGGNIGRDQALSSPWDVEIYYHNQDSGIAVPVLLIAIAGTHQIWALFMEDTIWWKNKLYKAGTCVAIVGNGREANRNNAYPHAASLAQPSGLAVAQNIKAVFIADSESSSIRRVHMEDGQVTAVAGANKNPTDLHNYGDVDGIRYGAKLQHPLGLAWDNSEKVLYVADTYNHKIKKVTPDGNCTTVYGAGKPTKDHVFDEPGGLAVLSNGKTLFIADTNNHCIKAVNKENAGIKTISIKLPRNIARTADKTFHFENSLSKDGGELIISLTAMFEGDLKFTAEAPQKWSLILPCEGWIAEKSCGNFTTPITVKIPEGKGVKELEIIVDLVVCKTDECIPKKFALVFSVDQIPDAPIVVRESKKLEIE